MSEPSGRFSSRATDDADFAKLVLPQAIYVAAQARPRKISDYSSARMPDNDLRYMIASAINRSSA